MISAKRTVRTKIWSSTQGSEKGLNDLQAATMWFMQNAWQSPTMLVPAPQIIASLRSGRAGYMHARMAKAAQAQLAPARLTRTSLKAKLVTAKFFMERLMPETVLRKTRIEAGCDTMMELSAKHSEAD